MDTLARVERDRGIPNTLSQQIRDRKALTMVLSVVGEHGLNLGETPPKAFYFRGRNTI